MTTKAFLLLLSAFILLPLSLHADNEAKKDITVLITGANRGLGLEMVKQFSADGYKVIGTARKPEKATDLGMFLPGTHRNPYPGAVRFRTAVRYSGSLITT